MKPFFAAGVATMLVACSPLLDNSSGRVVGLIDEAGTGFDALVAPDTVRAGTPFTVTVSTFGSSCLRPDGSESRIAGLEASITPYDVDPPSGSVCTADFRAFPRQVALTFTAPGTAVVRLQGRGFQNPMLVLAESIVVVP